MKGENVMYKSILDMAEGAIKERCASKCPKLLTTLWT